MSMKIVEQFQIKSKTELLGIMYKHLENQQQMAKQKWEIANSNETDGSLNGGQYKKKENVDLTEYNKQVQAVGNTISTILKIQKSDLPLAEGVELIENNEELVD